MNKEFMSYKLNENGIKRIEIIKIDFDMLLCQLKIYIPEGREFSIVKTKLEEACMFAIKAVSLDQKNQAE